MQKWEYLTCDTSALYFDAVLAERGKQGWELVTIVVDQVVGNSQSMKRLIFKRPIAVEWNQSTVVEE